MLSLTAIYANFLMGMGVISEESISWTIPINTISNKQ